ncbi:E3 ubiquitin-protein ligase RING1-like [Vitis vinifera]|uniref:RING-type E3 ubiquitin transferase n=1 Tax=Vitis vinifera TaxID=29760 RepID=A0A438GCW2_VITVI|nr:E3 ubiquitin-protein ligase RING1-like [Vitis vinifera]
METTHRCKHLVTKLWIPDYDPDGYSASTSSSSVRVDLTILWQLEHQWMNLASDGAASIISRCVVHSLALRLPLLDYQVFMSDHTCHQMLSGVLSSMGVDPNLHDRIIVKIVAFARSIQNLVSHMDAGMVFPLQARIRLVTMHVRNERVLIDLATRESMIENEGRGNGMIPATEISIKTLKTETILEGESCMICLEELGGGSEVTVMPCSHVFHGSCIIRWLKQSHVCPICRFEMPTCSQ